MEAQACRRHRALAAHQRPRTRPRRAIPPQAQGEEAEVAVVVAVVVAEEAVATPATTSQEETTITVDTGADGNCMMRNIL